MLKLGWYKLIYHLFEFEEICICARDNPMRTCAWGLHEHGLNCEKVKVASSQGGVNPYFFLHIYSSWVEIRLPTENQPSSLPGSALKVCVVVGGGGVDGEFSDQLWL